MRNELRLEFKLFFFVWHNTLRTWRFYHLYIYDIYDKSDKEQDFFFFLIKLGTCWVPTLNTKCNMLNLYSDYNSEIQLESR